MSNLQSRLPRRFLLHDALLALALRLEGPRCVLRHANAVSVSRKGTAPKSQKKKEETDSIMRLPLHAVRLAKPCASATTLSVCVDRALDSPLLGVAPVNDVIDVTYAFDIVVNDGVYLLFALLVIRAYVRSLVR